MSWSGAGAGEQAADVAGAGAAGGGRPRGATPRSSWRRTRSWSGGGLPPPEKLPMVRTRQRLYTMGKAACCCTFHLLAPLTISGSWQSE